MSTRNVWQNILRICKGATLIFHSVVSPLCPFVLGAIQTPGFVMLDLVIYLEIDAAFRLLRQIASARRESALSSFCSTISKFTKFSHFEHVNTLRYGDIFNTSSIVSSIEFDRDDEFFATAGVTKKIKIFEYGCIEKTGLAGTSLREDDRSEMYDGGDLARPSCFSSNKKPITSVLHYPVREMMCRSKIRYAHR